MGCSAMDEGLLTLSKLREIARGNLDAGVAISPVAGLPDEGKHASALGFADRVLTVDPDRDGGLSETALGAEIESALATRAADRAVRNHDTQLAAFLTGVTEAEFAGDRLTVTLEVLDRWKNDGAPAFFTIAGNPNTGKTSTAVHLVDLADRAGSVVDGIAEDLLVISNMDSWERSDYVVKSMHDLVTLLLEERDRPKVVVVDEGSTAFDARTFRREIAQQWSPTAKRFAKLHIDAAIVVGHTGKDLHPEVKRLTTTAVWKEEKRRTALFDRWVGEDSRPSEPVWPDPARDWEAPRSSFDPDDSATWSWDLKPGLWNIEAGSWSERLQLHRKRGPEPPD